jgi:CBS domain-containing protein
MPAGTPSAPAVLTLDSALVEDVMHPGAFTCFFETPLATVARLMAAHRVHCVVGFGDASAGDTRIWGLVTDRDVVAAAASDHVHRTAGTSAASEAVTIGPREPLRRAAEVMSERGLSHVLVVEPGSDRPLGILSTLDVAGVVGGVATSVKPGRGTRVDEIMTTPVVTVSPKTSLKEVAALLVERRISAVPVLADGDIVGIVPEGDIVGEESVVTESSVLARLLGGDRSDDSPLPGARTAAEAMAAPAITIEWSDSAETAATLMTQHHVNRLPVVRDGKLVGIVSRSDLVRAYARSDDEIEREITERVLPEWYLLQPEAVSVDVHKGEVSLHGTVETRMDLDELPRRIRQVPGVVSVTDSLALRSD